MGLDILRRKLHVLEPETKNETEIKIETHSGSSRATALKEQIKKIEEVNKIVEVIILYIFSTYP